MNRPYTLCYLNCSADGHIDGEFFRSEEEKKTIGIFRQRWTDYGADAIIYGAVTMRMFAAGRYPQAPEAEESCPADAEPFPAADSVAAASALTAKVDFHSDAPAKKYYIAIDPDGTVAYNGPYIDVRGRGQHGVIHAVTAKTPVSYLRYLREQGISYLFCGEESLDPVILMQKVREAFGVRKAILSGGAFADWTMLSAGLIDELTMMFSPVVDGNPAAHSVFMRSEGMEAKNVGMELVEIEKTEGDAFFVTYRPKNRLPQD